MNSIIRQLRSVAIEFLRWLKRSSELWKAVRARAQEKVKEAWSWVTKKVKGAWSWVTKKGGAIVLTKALAFASLLISVSIPIVLHQLPQPPHPRALLDCTTDGLPDLEVVCSTGISTRFHSGYIDFDDGSMPTKIETTSSIPVPTRFFDQLWTPFDQLWTLFVDQPKRNNPDTSPEEGLPSANKRFLQGIYHHKYKRVGNYRISLFLEGYEGTDSTVKVVTLQKSNPVEKKLVIEDLTFNFKKENPTRSFEFRIIHMLPSKNIIQPNRVSYTQNIRAPKGWILPDDNCDFKLSINLQSDDNFDREEIKYDDNGIKFTYSLLTEGWIWGLPYVLIDGVMQCEGELKDGLRENKKEHKEKEISQYGIIWVEDDKNSNLVYSSKDSIKTWSFRHGDDSYCSKGNEPIKIQCHNLELSLVDPPRLEPKDWRFKTWLKVARLN